MISLIASCCITKGNDYRSDSRMLSETSVNTLHMITPFRIGWLCLSLGLYALLGYGVARPQFPLLITLFGLVFWGYTRIIGPLWNYSGRLTDRLVTLPEPDRFLFGAAVLFRLSLFAATPSLSDDYVRFIWDGRLLAHGYNPFLYLPDKLSHTSMAASAGLTDTLYQSLNSPHYFTVYPPINQVLFGLVAWLSPDSIMGTVIGLRIPILLAECGALWLMVKLLRRFEQTPNLALLYGLNPLVILELTGNLHFEAVMIFFVLLAVWLLVHGRWVGSALVLGMGIGTKLLPLILLPLLIRYLGWKRGMSYAAIALGLTAVLFLPFVSPDLIRNLLSSLDLYFQKFEFNASIYYLLRAAGYWLLGFNAIAGLGVALFFLIAVSVLYIAFRTFSALPGTVFSTKVLIIFTLYWLLATTVHSWYITSLVAITVFTPFRYALLWSGVVMLSYATYRALPYHENLGLTAVEYTVVIGVGVFEWYRLKKQVA